MQSLPEYADWLDEREDVIWPVPPPVVAARAKPYTAHLPGIRAVTWDVYGTLLQVPDGRLEFDPKEEVRLQIALEKTIHEFNMWNSMTRKPGAPWEYMIRQYRDVLKQQRLGSGGVRVQKGELVHISLAGVWRVLVERLQQKDYRYDVLQYGSMNEFVEKVAYFFHSALQGMSAYDRALDVLRFVARRGLAQGLLSDGQSFTLIQLLRALRKQGPLPPLKQLFRPELLVLSCGVGMRKPSVGLFTEAAESLSRLGVRPDQVLHVGSRLKEDLAVARKVGFRTALFVGDQNSVEADRELLGDPETKPDRLIVNIGQISRIVGGMPETSSQK